MLPPRPLKETDLIYEGIATGQALSVFSFQIQKETDLIYEGIATKKDTVHIIQHDKQRN